MNSIKNTFLQITFILFGVFVFSGFTLPSPKPSNDINEYPQCYKQLTLFEKNIKQVHIYDLLGNNLGELPLTYNNKVTLCCIPYLITGEYILEITTEKSAELKSITVSP